MKQVGFKGLLLGLCLLASGTVAIAPDKAQAQFWEPQKPVELVIMAGKGGGADKMARRFQRIIEDEELSLVPFKPVNMPGESGAEALKYMEANKGNPHIVMVTLNTFYTTPLRRPELNIDIKNYTPIGRMAEDTFVLWVNAKSNIKTLDEFVAAAKAKGDKWIMSGTGTASEDNLLTDFLNDAYGLRMKYVAFPGGGAVAKELAEGRSDSTVNNPSEQETHYLNGETVPLASFTPERLQMLKHVPTLRESGKDMVYFMQRSVVGPPGISREVALFYQDVFREVYESKDWQDYMNEKGLRGQFLSGEELRNYWLRERDIHKDMLSSAGQLN